MVKFIIMIPKQPDMDREEFMHRWRDVCVPAVKQLPGLRRYVINPALAPGEGETNTYEGIAEMWFDDPASGMAAFDSPQGKDIMQDLATFADMDSLVMSVAEEQVIIA